jgi:hypothetical protein
MPTNKKSSINEFIEKSILVHGNKYDYSSVHYINAHTKVIIACQKHGEFIQTPSHHLHGQGCKDCYVRGQKLIYSTDQFVYKAKQLYGTIFDYSKVIYVKSTIKVEIICSKHGSFWQIPSFHLQGHGCIACRSEINSSKFTKTLDQFISDAKDIHGNRYDYSKAFYIVDAVKLQIICQVHGSFWQSPTNHLYGKGCPSCSKNISYKEIKWLDSLTIPDEFRNKKIKINGKTIKPDAYNPIINSIYEFYGDYWHGNPKIYDSEDINVANKKSFGTLFNETIKREFLIKNAGYSMITIWESDFDASCI